MRILLVCEGPHELHGAVEAILQRLIPRGDELVFETRRISDARVHAAHGREKQLVKRVVAWAREATRENFDALVVLLDEDGDPRRRADINEAQNNAIFSLPRAIGIAIKSFDAWMVADETALSKVLKTTIQCQPSPEELDNPKQLYKELHATHNPDMQIREAYAQIASHARLDMLSKRCPLGFAPFAARVRTLRKES